MKYHIKVEMNGVPDEFLIEIGRNVRTAKEAKQKVMDKAEEANCTLIILSCRKISQSQSDQIYNAIEI